MIQPAAAMNNGGELFEKFQRQKMNRELVNSMTIPPENGSW